MTSKELSWIKNAQREYEKMFGSRLHIDFMSMKRIGNDHDISFDLLKSINPRKFDKNIVNDLCKKYELTLEEVKNIKGIKSRNRKLFLIEFSKIVFNKRWDVDECAKFLGLERTTIYYYGNIELYGKQRREYQIKKRQEQIIF